MRNLFQILILSCTLTGCIMTHDSDLHVIINENVSIYQNNEKVKFTNVAAIFKSYANLINSKDYTSLRELKKDSAQFIGGLKGNKISSNYPVVANEDEINIADRLISGLIKYLSSKEIKPSNFQQYINEATKVYITEIVYYEQIH